VSVCVAEDSLPLPPRLQRRRIHDRGACLLRNLHDRLQIIDSEAERHTSGTRRRRTFMQNQLEIPGMKKPALARQTKGGRKARR